MLVRCEFFFWFGFFFITLVCLLGVPMWGVVIQLGQR